MEDNSIPRYVKESKGFHREENLKLRSVDCMAGRGGAWWSVQERENRIHFSPMSSPV